MTKTDSGTTHWLVYGA